MRTDYLVAARGFLEGFISSLPEKKSMTVRFESATHELNDHEMFYDLRGIDSGVNVGPTGVASSTKVQ